ncbi:haloacid dehalogenase type II [Saccharopolyspora oryzae]|uniref:Haloacid dehalogenase type II n=1 Tax=Saccharopolyspora oryzae TaxID=2997343 RepID=A0ABT4UUZ3_9PSEU|nr:haloacid dehalogenase type II [Saccharopolyspora oryzae]MDA3625523.1 haloacid dehalogenase type II [Saccharopolyspora oryzae]
MDLLGYTPKYITFDCYGTLTNFQMTETVLPLIADRIAPEDTPTFIKDFRAYRIDEVIGEYKPYQQVLRDSWQRACNRWRIQYRAGDADTIVEAVGSWGPHPEVPEALGKLAAAYPLVILSNAADAMFRNNVEQLGVDFHRVFTAEQAGAYKPRYRAFEYMLDQLGAERDEILHVSSHIWYDVIPAHELRIRHKVYVNRGYDPSVPFYEYAETTDLAGVPPLLGL